MRKNSRFKSKKALILAGKLYLCCSRIMYKLYMSPFTIPSLTSLDILLYVFIKKNKKKKTIGLKVYINFKTEHKLPY